VPAVALEAWCGVMGMCALDSCLFFLCDMEGRNDGLRTALHCNGLAVGLLPVWLVLARLLVCPPPRPAPNPNSFLSWLP
jgi:hypothetical protein